jgi:hypothetical protein
MTYNHPRQRIKCLRNTIAIFPLFVHHLQIHSLQVHFIAIAATTFYLFIMGLNYCHHIYQSLVYPIMNVYEVWGRLQL